jgi:DNA-binding winged helix-turn-helix (wHTH) protein
VDVHVRRLRAKLGVEHESLIGTVRNVGYRFVVPEKTDKGEAPEKAAEDADNAGEKPAGDAQGTSAPENRQQAAADAVPSGRAVGAKRA